MSDEDRKPRRVLTAQKEDGVGDEPEVEQDEGQQPPMLTQRGSGLQTSSRTAAPQGYSAATISGTARLSRLATPSP